MIVFYQQLNEHMNLTLILVILFIILVIGFVVYWFWWRKPSPSIIKQPKPPTTNNDNINHPKDDTTKQQPLAPNDDVSSSSDNSHKWTHFKENKKINLNKFKEDYKVNIKNKLQPKEFSEIMARPCDIDKSLFEPDKIDNPRTMSAFSYDALISGIAPMDEIDINKLDTLDDFNSHGFKNIDDLTGETEQDNKQLNNVELINSELFGI